MNPMALLKIKEMMDGFNARHPKLSMFFRDVGSKIDTGAVLELSVTTPDGEKIRTNIKVAPEDKELISALTSLAGKKGE